MGIMGNWLGQQMQRKMQQDEFRKRQEEIDKQNAIAGLQMSPIMSPMQQASLQQPIGQQATPGDMMRQEMMQSGGLIGSMIKMSLFGK